MRSLRAAGFTLIELIVVLAVIGLLLSIAAPRFAAGVDRSKEAVLRQNLKTMRAALDQYRADRGKPPESLEALVGNRYLKEVPLDPVTGSRADWVVVAPPEDSGELGVYDVRSNAQGNASDGSAFADW